MMKTRKLKNKTDGAARRWLQRIVRPPVVFVCLYDPSLAESTLQALGLNSQESQEELPALSGIPSRDNRLWKDPRLSRCLKLWQSFEQAHRALAAEPPASVTGPGIRGVQFSYSAK